MMTLFLVKSTLVSRCVCTREIVRLISRITARPCLFFIPRAAPGLRARYEWDSPFIFQSAAPAAVV